MVISSICWVRVIRVLISAFWESVAEELDRVGDIGSGGTTIVDL
jgi:hypothetical protein